MANVLKTNPLNIDTAAVIEVGGSGALDIMQMVWIGMADTNAIVIKINGISMTFTHTDAIDGEEKYILQGPVGVVKSFEIVSIAAGNLYVFID